MQKLDAKTKNLLFNKEEKTMRSSQTTPNSIPQVMTTPAITCLIFFVSALAGLLIISNLAAMKIWDLLAPLKLHVEWLIQDAPNWYRNLPSSLRLISLFQQFPTLSLPVDGGIIMFPFTYIIGDLLVEIYGKRTANSVAINSFLVVFLTCPLLSLVNFLPSHASADNSAFTTITSMISRVFIASLVSFLVSQYVNNYVFVKLRQKKFHKFWQRALISSLFAHLVDTIIFETIAFYGRLPFSEFIAQISFAFIAGVALEAILLRYTSLIATKLTQKLQFNDGKILQT